MRKSDQINELSTALAKVQGKLRPAQENATNPFLKNRYADLGSVWDTCRDLLAEHELSVAQFPSSDGDGIGLTTILSHSSGQWMEETIHLPLTEEKGKSSAQVAGSIISYLRRYSLAAVLGIVAGDDDDGTMGGDPRKKNGSKQAPAPTDAMKRKLHAVGSDFYADDWDTKRAELCKHITNGRTDSSNDLTGPEMAKLIDGIEKRLAEREKVTE